MTTRTILLQVSASPVYFRFHTGRLVSPHGESRPVAGGLVRPTPGRKRDGEYTVEHRGRYPHDPVNPCLLNPQATNSESITMVNRIYYFLQRAARIPKALFTPLGAVAGIATITGLGAMVIGGSASPWLGSISLVFWLIAILVIGDRLSDIWQQLNREPVDRVAEVDSAPSRPAQTDTVPSGKDQPEPDRHPPAQIAPIGNEESAADQSNPPPTAHSQPLVSIVIACFNEERYISSCLESVRNQTYQNWECIVVDDASTDGSVRTAWGPAQADERIRVVRHTRNAGLSAARNTGLRLAGGELVTFLDGDDFLAPDSLADRVLHFVRHESDPVVAGVYCGTALAPEDARPQDYETSEKWSGSRVNFLTSGDRCPFNVHALIGRTSILVAAGGFTESMRHGAEDWDLWYRVMRNGFRFEPSGLRSTVYRQKLSSMRQRHALEHFAEAERLTRLSQCQAEASLVFSDLAPPMLRPKSDYEMSALLTTRAIQSAATSLLAGNESEAVTMLAAIDPVHPIVMSTVVQTEIAIVDGFRRYLGMTRDEIALLQEHAPLAERAAQLVTEHVPLESFEFESHRPELDILLVPQTSCELQRMLAAVGQTDLQIGVVDSSAVAGDQGVTDLLATRPLPGATIQSYNEAVLRPTAPKVVVLSYPWDAALDELALSLADNGASVVRLRNDLEDTLRISEAPPSRVPIHEISTSELSGACADNDIESLLGSGHIEPDSTGGTPLPANTDAAAAWMIEENPGRAFDAREIARFKGLHTGERVVIIGNGPSLNDLDLSLLRGTPTIGVNGIFYAADRLPEPLSYYVVEDTLVVRDNLERIRSYEAGHRFFPSIYREMIGEGANTSFFMMNRGFYAPESPAFCIPRFSTDPAQRIYSGQSVTTMNLQLAYYMGFEEVILIGMDFSYTVPESSQIDGIHITSMEDDPNHFHPDYFGKGKVWKDPKLDRVLANYALAKQMFEADGRRIVNATPGGNLQLFDRVPFEDLFSR